MVRCRLVDWFKKVRVCTRPCRQLIVSLEKLISDSINTASQSLLLSTFKPIPEPGSNIKRIITILCLDEDVGINEKHYATPNSSARFSNVARFFVPSN